MKNVFDFVTKYKKEITIGTIVFLFYLLKDVIKSLTQAH